MKIISTSNYTEKIAAHYGTQPGVASPSQNVDGLGTDLFVNDTATISDKKIEELWGKRRKRKKRRKPKPEIESFPKITF